jgi:hypothetical protein
MSNLCCFLTLAVSACSLGKSYVEVQSISKHILQMLMSHQVEPSLAQ